MIEKPSVKRCTGSEHILGVFRAMCPGNRAVPATGIHLALLDNGSLAWRDECFPPTWQTCSHSNSSIAPPIIEAFPETLRRGGGNGRWRPWQAHTASFPAVLVSNCSRPRTFSRASDGRMATGGGSRAGAGVHSDGAGIALSGLCAVWVYAGVCIQ